MKLNQHAGSRDEFVPSLGKNMLVGICKGGEGRKKNAQEGTNRLLNEGFLEVWVYKTCDRETHECWRGCGTRLANSKAISSIRKG